MSKKFKLLIFLFICLIALLPVKAEAAETNNVKDYLNYLSETEVQELQSKINEISNKFNLDTVIVITDNTEEKTSMQYADDFYDNNNYGLDSEKSGVLMLINMNAREVWISTKGTAITIFTDSTIKTMVNDITKHLSDKDYHGASSKFLEKVDYYSKANSTTPTSYSSRLKDRVTAPSSYIICFIISIIVTLIATLRSKWKVTVNNTTYEGEGSFNLTNNKDIFVNQNTTRTKIPKKSNENTSTTHESSSGSTHGGGGGSF
ncbi:hypothetical protein GCM10008904_08900 [Paraclostridium ghonii]|uniref:TPM domain-containing protein n=1 Tax=Paraclostridium ghonii TaxID=29358 RepID=A0ABU0N1Z1_9FIRM|nr:uncharacterized protein [Paeniclostridium ghonii]